MKIGIGITCRHRPHILGYALNQFGQHWPSEETCLFVSDDSEQMELALDNATHVAVADLPHAHYSLNTPRLGIAGNKNRCIEHLYASNCTHFFLFDEDTYPIKDGWEKLYIIAGKNHNCHHMMYNHIHGCIKLKERHLNCFSTTNCMGVMLYFTREVVDKIGGFDPAFKKYGYEHANFSLRAHYAGMTGGLGQYIVPNNADRFIESLDIVNSLGLNPGHPMLHEIPFRSSVHGEDLTESLEHNSKLCIPSREDLYRPFKA